MIAAFPALVREVPELRRTLLKGRVFLGPQNRLPVYAAAAAAILHSRALLIAATGWWTYERVKDQRSAAGRWHEKLLALRAELQTKGRPVRFVTASPAGNLPARSSSA